MKKLIILSAIAMSGLFYNTAYAQIRVHLGFGFGPHRVVYAAAPVVVEQAAPAYNEPAQVYNNNDDYYYLPDVGAYYDVTAQCYYYNDGANWVSAAYLPGEYRGYDWRNARRFEVREPRPYLHDDFYRSRFNGRENSAFVNNNYNRNNYEHIDNRNQGYNEHFDNRGQEDFNRPAYQNNGHEWGDNRGRNEHFVQANQRGGNENHKAFRF